MDKLVYTFGKGKADGAAAMKALLGGKGANLAEMARLGLPVPPGFTISTEACRHYLAHAGEFPELLDEQMDAGLQWIEKITGRRFGDADNPLLVSVRSGAAASMPGMMDTILNLGLNDQTVQGIIHKTDNPRFGFDSYRRFIQMYSNVVLGMKHALFEEALQALKASQGVRDDTALTAAHLETLIGTYLDIVRQRNGTPFPQDPADQLTRAIGAVFASWNGQRAREYRRIAHIPHDLGTACTVQAMVFGNMGSRSATGVVFTRDPTTGENVFFGEYLPNAQGEDVVAGLRTPQPLNRHAAARLATHNHQAMPVTLEEQQPACYAELSRIRQKLEKHYRDMQDVEFTIEEDRLWVLQTRRGKRTAAAAVRIAVDMVEERLLTREEALLRVEPRQIEQLLHPTFVPAAKSGHAVLAIGLPASPGAAVGRVVFSADDAVEWHRRGERVLLVRQETSPEDIHGMVVAQGFLTATGGMTSHAAVVARGMGKPCVAGCHALQLCDRDRCCTIGAATLREGDWLSIDGASGEVMQGQVPVQDAAPDETFYRLMDWADAHRRLRVRANAETARDVRVALDFGAEGIGLARTEHMFFEPGRIDVVREMILAGDAGARKRALAKLLPLQKADIRMLLAAMDGKPVTIRLLDPPLHEFLPHTADDIAAVAAASGQPVDAVRAAMERLHEQNPMLGHRGCRLGISHPEIYAMQVQAMVEAACELQQEEQLASHLEIEIPLVGHVNELRHLRAVATKVAEEVIVRTGVRIDYQIGAMLELPRACLTADALAAHADFLSFGTNDLTQTVLGMSRDDSAGFLHAYVEQQLFPADPFVTIDHDGVGQLMRMAVERSRTVKPALPIGICGEHGGDPASIAFCDSLKLDYVSCSPYRVPVARLAAAQAVLTQRQGVA